MKICKWNEETAGLLVNEIHILATDKVQHKNIDLRHSLAVSYCSVPLKHGRDIYSHLPVV